MLSSVAPGAPPSRWRTRKPIHPPFALSFSAVSSLCEHSSSIGRTCLVALACYSQITTPQPSHGTDTNRPSARYGPNLRARINIRMRRGSLPMRDLSSITSQTRRGWKMGNCCKRRISTRFAISLVSPGSSSPPQVQLSLAKLAKEETSQAGKSSGQNPARTSARLLTYMCH